MSDVFHTFTIRAGEMERVYTFAQTTSNATEEIITQMVLRLKPVKLAREGRKKQSRRGEKDPWVIARYYGGGSHRLLHTFARHSMNDMKGGQNTRGSFPLIRE